MKNIAYLCNAFRKQRELSSAGSERLPYKQRVGGSNPSAPTENETIFEIVSFFRICYPVNSREVSDHTSADLKSLPLKRPAIRICSFTQSPQAAAREKHNICGSKNRAVRRGGLLPHSRRRRRTATKVQTPSRHSSLESAYLAPRQGIDIIPQFVAVGSAAITVIGRQYMPLAKGTKIILAARLQKQSALRTFIVLAPHGIARRAADIAAVEQVQFSRLKEYSRDMRKQDE